MLWRNPSTIREELCWCFGISGHYYWAHVFDRSQIWLKSEYYEPRDYSNARVIFKPCDTFDAVERFDYDREKRGIAQPCSTPYHCCRAVRSRACSTPALESRSSSSLREREIFVIVLNRRRTAAKNALKDIGNGSILLMPAWEVKDGSLTGESQEEPESEIAFTSLEEYARIRPPEETAAAAAPEAELLQDETAQLRAAAAREHSPEPENPKSNCTEKAEPDASEILEAAHSFAAQKPQQSEKSSESEHVRLPEAPEDREILDAAHKAAESKDNAGKMESEKFAAALKEAERTAAVPVTEEEYLEADSEGAPLSAGIRSRVLRFHLGRQNFRPRPHGTAQRPHRIRRRLHGRKTPRLWFPIIIRMAPSVMRALEGRQKGRRRRLFPEF